MHHSHNDHNMTNRGTSPCTGLVGEPDDAVTHRCCLFDMPCKFSLCSTLGRRTCKVRQISKYKCHRFATTLRCL